MRFVHFYGSLAEKYGSSHYISANSMRDVVWWGQANYKDFFATIRQGSYQVVRGTLSCGDVMDSQTVTMQFGQGDLHIVPVAEGAGGEGSKGIMTAILGVALLATAIIIPGASAALTMASPMFTGGLGAAMLGGMTFTQLALLGGTLALAGITQILSPAPQIGDYNRGDDKRSFLFAGPHNNYEEGGPIPLVIGRFLCPPCVASTEVDTTDYDDDDPDRTEYYIRIFCETDGGGDPYGTIVIGGLTIANGTKVAVAKGDDLTVTINADSGYIIEGIDVNNGSISYTNLEPTTRTFILKDVYDDGKIMAQFGPESVAGE